MMILTLLTPNAIQVDAVQLQDNQRLLVCVTYDLLTLKKGLYQIDYDTRSR